MTVFLTGISGLLGTHLALLLLQKGYKVKGLVRNKKAFIAIDHSRLLLIEGDLFTDLEPYLQDVDCVIHAAACTATHLIRYSDYHKINYEATVHLLESSIRAEVPKFIFVSTANTIGYHPNPAQRPEDEPMCAPFNRLLYAISKHEAEQYLLLQKDRITVQVVNPGFIIGAYGGRRGSSRMVLMGMKKRILFYPPGGKNFVGAPDVARAIEQCMRWGKNGCRYLIACENMSYGAFFKRLQQHTGKKQWLIPLPRIVWVLLGYAGDILRRIGIPTSLCSANMRALTVNNFYCNSSSVLELNMKYEGIDKFLAASVQYFKEKGAATIP